MTRLANAVVFLVAVSLVLSLKIVKRQSASQNAIIEVFNDCKCVPHYQCDADGYIITATEEAAIEPRFGASKNKIPCTSNSSVEHICCKENRIERSPEEENGASDIVTPAPEIQDMLCGSQRTIINTRIFAGEDDLLPIEGEFPWLAAIFEKTPSGNYNFCCSGSLIHPKVVLTANHRVNSKEPSSLLVVVNGKITLSFESKPEEERFVSEIISHPDFNGRRLYNDAALLILNKPFVSTKQLHINTLCLPQGVVNLENTRCLVTGWGKEKNGEGKQVLRKVDLPFVNHSECQNNVRQAGLGKKFKLHDSFMCAGGEDGKDACKGDGGSPLMCPMPSETHRYFQAGIVSWGLGCGRKNVPGVYTDVQKLSGWIKNELLNRINTVEES